MAGDPLSEILSVVEARSIITGGIAAGGSWSLRFPPPRKIKLFAIAKGSAWLIYEGRRQPLRLETGDVVLVAEPSPFVLTSDLTALPLDAADVYSRVQDGFVRLGEGEDFFMLGGHVDLDDLRGALLVDALPAFIHVRSSAPEAALVGQLLQQLVIEVKSGREGKELAVDMLTQLMFLQLIRAYLDQPHTGPRGWLRALADERIAPTMHLMHSDPGRAWSLDDLARSAAMSRSAFALHFKNVVGVTPLAYLTHWRMRLAERALREGKTTVSSLAFTLGYASDSAFSNAFKRVVGVAPKHYRAAPQSPS